MSDVNQQCVSLANGTISPDLRVNYEFGMVLGVDDFRQEQDYLLQKEYLYNRALHGFGTVSGLHVTTERPQDNTQEVLITVEPGMGIDQWGRPIVVRNAQCARLGAWLANQQQQNPAAVTSHTGPSGDMHVYVVASYDECPDALVPLPGQPCSSSDTTQTPSRIRDSYNIELRWEPPSMPAWSVVLNFAQLMATVQIVAGLPPAQSDEEEIIARVRSLSEAFTPSPFPSFGSPPQGSPPETGQFLRLPAAGAREALDRIFTFWATEVRPTFAPDLIDPGTSEAGILLTTLDFIPAVPFSTSVPAIASYQEPDDTERPYLLHTQLIQELLLLGGEAQAATPANVDEFVTFNTVAANTDSVSLSAWFHTPAPVEIPSSLQAVPGAPETTTPVTFSTSANSRFSYVWTLTATVTPQNAADLRDKSPLTFSFDTDSILVGGASTNLSSIIASQQQTYLGYDGQHTIQAFYELDIPPAPKPSQPFVTLSLESGVQTVTQLIPVEVWFHLDAVNPVLELVTVTSLTSKFLTVLAETTNRTLRSLNIQNIAQRQPNVFTVTLEPIGNLKPPFYLRFVFLPELEVSVRAAVRSQIIRNMSLSQYIQESGIVFEGETGNEIVAYLRVPVGTPG